MLDLQSSGGSIRGMFRRLVLLVVVAGVTACAGAVSSVPASRSSSSKSALPPEAKQPATTSSGCQEWVDTSIGLGTEFPYVVEYERSADTIGAGDRIRVTEVRGTRPRFERGGIYLVKGEYTLSSADEARLLFSVTAEGPGGCTKGNPRGAQNVARGSGTFELAAPFPYDGKPHVTFYVRGSNAGGVYLAQ